MKKNLPAIYPLSFKNVKMNEDGYYKKEEVLSLFSDVIKKYDDDLK